MSQGGNDLMKLHHRTVAGARRIARRLAAWLRKAWAAHERLLRPGPGDPHVGGPASQT